MTSITLLNVFSVFTSRVLKARNRNHIMNKVKNLEYNNLAKNQVSFVFYSRVISRSVSPCLCPLEGHKHGGRKATKTSVTEFCH